MASIGTIQTTVSSTVAQSTTSYAEVVESSALTSGVTYYVICHALCRSSLTHQTASFRLVDRTNSDAVLSNSEMIREPNSATSTQSYYFLGKFTAGSDGGGLAFEQKSGNAGWDVATEYLSMMLLDLSELETGDFFFANDTREVNLTDTYVDFATASPTVTDGDEWLVLGWQATDTNMVNASSTLVQLDNDGLAESSLPISMMEGEDATEVLNVLLGRTFTVGGGGNFDFAIKSKHTGVPATPNKHLESTLLGIRLDAFVGFSTFWNKTESTTTSTGFNEYGTLAFNPSATGEAVVFGSSLFTPLSVATGAYAKVTVDGTTSPNAVPDTKEQCRSNDATDILPMSYITKYTLDGSSKTIDYDCKKDTIADIGFGKRSLVAFTAEIAETGSSVFTAVASQTYNSGDVAGQTYSSGDVASEVQPT